MIIIAAAPMIPIVMTMPKREARRRAASQSRGNAGGVVSWRSEDCFGGRTELEGSLKMTGHNPFSNLRNAMSPERQAANAAATEKAISNSQVTRLTGPDAELVMKMLETPPEPTEALVEAFKRRRRTIESR